MKTIKVMRGGERKKKKRIGIPPCPFCGSKKLNRVHLCAEFPSGEDYDGPYIECCGCGAGATEEAWYQRIK